MEQILTFVAGGNELASKMTPALRSKLIAAMPGLKERAKTLAELFEASRYVWASRPLALDDAAREVLTPDAIQILRAVLPRLDTLQEWSPSATEAVLRSYAEENTLKLGAVAQPVRAALTGKTTSPPIFDVLTVLGRDESLARLRDRVPAP
jgi:glutamyl-tRNA synthetase